MVMIATMKRVLFFFGIALVFLMPLRAAGMERNNYLLIRSGIYTFTNDLRDATFATGFDGEIAYGRYICPNLVFELGTGYFHDGVNKGYGNHIKGEPVTLTAKAVYPYRRIELFAGGGGGAYFTKFHGMVNGIVADRSDTVFGGHVVAGVHYALSRPFFFGLEGRYIFTESADFVIFKPRLDGYTITGSFGFRF
jgi:opacity protein-like surface antigen